MKTEEIIYWLGTTIINKKDELFKVVLDERYLMRILKEWFKHCEIELIPKKRGK